MTESRIARKIEALRWQQGLPVGEYQISREQAEAWDALHNWRKEEYEKLLPQMELWHAWQAKLLRDERWPWWKQFLMVVFNRIPSKPVSCSCVMGWLESAYGIPIYYTDNICKAHAEQFGVRAGFYTENELGALARAMRKYGR